ncbi:unnamed protein product [Meloidogyne enterolobii]|uniref:Uncharacterized protein n=1 Tax=Meloidogyne enterolobii TaxID=390850 RepID=A0ACB1APM6_MELEN
MTQPSLFPQILLSNLNSMISFKSTLINQYPFYHQYQSIYIPQIHFYYTNLFPQYSTNFSNKIVNKIIQ